MKKYAEAAPIAINFTVDVDQGITVRPTKSLIIQQGEHNARYFQVSLVHDDMPVNLANSEVHFLTQPHKSDEIPTTTNCEIYDAENGQIMVAVKDYMSNKKGIINGEFVRVGKDGSSLPFKNFTISVDGSIFVNDGLGQSEPLHSLVSALARVQRVEEYLEQEFMDVEAKYAGELSKTNAQLSQNKNIIDESGLERLGATSKFITTLQSWIGLINTKFTDNATRFYILAKDKVTTGVGGCIKIFGDAYHLGQAYRDLGIYFHADQNGDKGYYGNGVFWINSKVLEGSEYDGKNSDIGFSFQDGQSVAGRFVRFSNGKTVFVVGASSPKSHTSGEFSAIEIQGNASISNNQMLMFMSNDGLRFSSMRINKDDELIESLIGDKKTYINGVLLSSLSENKIELNKSVYINNANAVFDEGYGVVLTSDNGIKFKLIVSNDGALTTERI